MSVRSLLTGLFKVGVIGFGGGAILIPVMERELVGRLGLLDEGTFTSHAVIANVTPGAFPVKLASLAASRMGGPLLVFLAGLTVSLPGALGGLVLMWLLDLLGQGAVRVVEFASVGVSAFIIAVLAGYIRKVVRNSRPHLVACVAVMAATFLATGASTAVSVLGSLVGQDWAVDLPHLSALHVILLALAVIGVWSLVDRRSAPAVPAPALGLTRTRGGALAPAGAGLAVVAVVIALAFLLGAGQLFSLMALSVVTTFGGGAAYIAVADGFFVADGLVDSTVFYSQMVPIANALPGPVMVKLASLVGYSAGGSPLESWLLGLLALALVIGACAAVATLFLAGYDKTSGSTFIARLGTWILPVICGLLITTGFGMLEAGVAVTAGTGVPDAVMVAAIVGAAALLGWLSSRLGWDDIVLILLAAVTSVALLLAVV